MTVRHIPSFLKVRFFNILDIEQRIRQNVNHSLLQLLSPFVVQLPIIESSLVSSRASNELYLFYDGLPNRGTSLPNSESPERKPLDTDMCIFLLLDSVIINNVHSIALWSLFQIYSQPVVKIQGYARKEFMRIRIISSVTHERKFFIRNSLFTYLVAKCLSLMDIAPSDTVYCDSFTADGFLLCSTLQKCRRPRC